MKQSFALERQYEASSLAPWTDVIQVVFRSQRVNVIAGSDGICVDGAGARRVVSFRSISRVEISDEDRLTIEHARGFEFLKGDAARVQEASQVITLRRDRFRVANIGKIAIAELVTSGAAHDRIAQLRSLGAAAVAPYRHMSIAREELWSLAENPASSISERVAAITVLRVRSVEDFSARADAMIEEIVDDVAARSLRIAARGDDQELQGLFVEERPIDVARLSLPERLRRRKAL